ncbi:UbiA prenyltransferase family [Mycena polygramma]|nr:UbiA prenyltransferase family [Mycena polygramma]
MSSPPTTKPSSLTLVPAGFRPYLELIRLEKPTGTILMFWPFVWGLTMAAYTTGLPLHVYFAHVAKALVSAFLLRSSACTINDIFDRKMDAGVERSKTRPLPSGRISVLAATLYLFLQYALGVAFFYRTEDGLALQVALFQLLPLFAIYPLLKRVTHWPQAWLGFAMNFGFVTAWVSVQGTLDYPVVTAAMISCWCWTMLYDTIYACQDIRDDVQMGVRSTAILFGSWIRPLLITFGIIFVCMLAIAGALNGQGAPYFIISIGGTLLHLRWQLQTVNLNIPSSCWDNFNSNGKLGWIVWAGLMLDYVLAHRHLVPRFAAA